MTNEEALEVIKQDIPCEQDFDLIEALTMAIKALETIPKYKDAYNKGWDDEAKATYEHLKMCEEEQSGDLISRQAVLDALYELCDTGETLIENPWRDNPHIDALVDTIEQLPSVNPQGPNTGHWIEKDGFDGDVYYDCSECGESWTTIEGTPWQNGMNYCPNCGARMESEG